MWANLYNSTIGGIDGIVWWGKKVMFHIVDDSK